MTLRIREVVIHAEVGADTDSRPADRESAPSGESVSPSEPGSLTRMFYEEDVSKVNER